MDAKSLDILELPKVLEQLAGFASFSASKGLARSLLPTNSLAEARGRQAATTEASYLLSVHSGITIGGAHDVRPLAESAARGVVLEPSELLEVKDTLVAARSLGRVFEKLDDECPVLCHQAGDLVPTPGLIDAISQTIDDRGEVLDGASDKLRNIRSDLAIARERLMGKLQKLISDPKLASMLQDAIITQRGGRYVVPLRAEFKGRLKSVVHDQSSSGATLFVEPLEVVDLNNQVRELELAERDEIRRILAAVSAQVGDGQETIRQTVHAIAQIDLALAKARMGEKLRASEPILHPAGGGAKKQGIVFKLRKARHPLLDQETVVPIDLDLGSGTQGLVITGPNTGGKTVTLKTAGLLTLMAQCGLHITAESGSELSVFDEVLADIGDEQSIEQSLSTFSSHVTNVIRILERANDRSLVLLDELGAGTDPQEGAALARALLQAFLDMGVTILVATHYPELKTYAHATRGIRNASVEFDVRSLKPTYHLTIGLPGRSNALAIAERLGLSPRILEAARFQLAPEDLSADSLLDEIRRQREESQRELQRARAQRELADSLRADLAGRLEHIEDERVETLAAARRQSQDDIEALRDELKDLRAKLTAAAQPLEALAEIDSRLDELEAEAEEPVVRDVPDVPRTDRPVQLGDRVQVVGLGAEGIVVDLGREEAEIQVGRLRVKARRDALELAAPHPQDAYASAQRPTGSTSVKASGPPPLELDLRGMTADEALDVLERHLDAAYLSGLPFVRIIHGKGTGKLRDVVRRSLQDNAYVRSFEGGRASEGGEGVTVVRLADSK